jgi:hypothetical protein
VAISPYLWFAGMHGTAGALATSAKVKVNQDMLTQKIGYRAIDNAKIKVDGLVGFRYFHMGSTVTLQPQIGNGFYASAD